MSAEFLRRRYGKAFGFAEWHPLPPPPPRHSREVKETPSSCAKGPQATIEKVALHDGFSLAAAFTASQKNLSRPAGAPERLWLEWMRSKMRPWQESEAETVRAAEVAVEEEEEGGKAVPGKRP